MTYKHHKQDIFGPKQKVLFYLDLCMLKKSIMLIPNITKGFSNPIPKLPQKAILVARLIFFFFDVDLSIFSNPKVVFSNMIITFSHYGLKLQKKDFVPQPQSFFVLHETWHFDKFHCADFRYDNSFFKLNSKSNK